MEMQAKATTGLIYYDSSSDSDDDFGPSGDRSSGSLVQTHPPRISSRRHGIRASATASAGRSGIQTISIESSDKSPSSSPSDPSEAVAGPVALTTASTTPSSLSELSIFNISRDSLVSSEDNDDDDIEVSSFASVALRAAISSIATEGSGDAESPKRKKLVTFKSPREFLYNPHAATASAFMCYPLTTRALCDAAKADVREKGFKLAKERRTCLKKSTTVHGIENFLEYQKKWTDWILLLSKPVVFDLHLDSLVICVNARVSADGTEMIIMYDDSGKNIADYIDDDDDDRACLTIEIPEIYGVDYGSKGKMDLWSLGLAHNLIIMTTPTENIWLRAHCREHFMNWMLGMQFLGSLTTPRMSRGKLAWMRVCAKLCELSMSVDNELDEEEMYFILVQATRTNMSFGPALNATESAKRAKAFDSCVLEMSSKCTRKYSKLLPLLRKFREDLPKL